MKDNNNHSMRLAIALTVLVAALVVMSIDRFAGSDGSEQQAAVLGVYGE